MPDCPARPLRMSRLCRSCSWDSHGGVTPGGWASVGCHGWQPRVRFRELVRMMTESDLELAERELRAEGKTVPLRV